MTGISLPGTGAAWLRRAGATVGSESGACGEVLQVFFRLAHQIERSSNEDQITLGHGALGELERIGEGPGDLRHLVAGFGEAALELARVGGALVAGGAGEDDLVGP